MKKKGLASLLTAVTLAAGMVTAVPVSAADGNGNTVTLTTNKDANVQTWKDEKLENYGSSWDIKVAPVAESYQFQVNSVSSWTWDIGNTTDWKLGYIGFDTSTVTGEIEKAELKLNVYSNDRNGSATLYVMPATNGVYKLGNDNEESSTVADTWIEGTGGGSGSVVGTDYDSVDTDKGIAWVAKPYVTGLDEEGDTFTSVAIGTVSNVGTGEVTIDVTNYVKDAERGQLTFAIAGDAVISLVSKEAEGRGNASQLVITTAEEPTEAPSANFVAANFESDNAAYTASGNTLKDKNNSENIAYGYKAALSMGSTSYNGVKAYVKVADGDDFREYTYDGTVSGNAVFYVVTNKAIDTDASKVYCE